MLVIGCIVLFSVDKIGKSLVVFAFIIKGLRALPSSVKKKIRMLFILSESLFRWTLLGKKRKGILLRWWRFNI